MGFQWMGCEEMQVYIKKRPPPPPPPAREPRPTPDIVCKSRICVHSWRSCWSQNAQETNRSAGGQRTIQIAIPCGYDYNHHDDDYALGFLGSEKSFFLENMHRTYENYPHPTPGGGQTQRPTPRVHFLFRFLEFSVSISRNQVWDFQKSPVPLNEFLEIRPGC